MGAIEAANNSLLPKKTRQKQIDHTHLVIHGLIQQEGGCSYFLAKDRYHPDPSEEKREEVATKKDRLKACYNEVGREILNYKIRKVEDTADRCKNKESRNLVNKITGRTRSSCGFIEGGGSAERFENWRKHFSGLLGQPPSVADANMPIRNIHPPLIIDTGPFSLEELQLTKKQIVEGKAHGDDSPSPEG